MLAAGNVLAIMLLFISNLESEYMYIARNVCGFFGVAISEKANDPMHRTLMRMLVPLQKGLLFTIDWDVLQLIT